MPLKLLAAATAFLLLLTGCDIRRAEQSQWGSFTAEATYSYDNKYRAEQAVEADGDLKTDMVQILVFDTASNQEVYRFKAARARDFWGVCWEKDSYTIWIQSGDTGTACYRYENNAWVLEEAAVRPDYIVSKYDK